LALEPSLLVALHPEQLMFVAGQAVKLPSCRELISRDAEEGGRLGRRRELFFFLCPGVISWKGDALGVFPPAADVIACEEEVQSLLPSPLSFSW
jgi:hypothetical protein